jgi:hypothetical protein
MRVAIALVACLAVALAGASIAGARGGAETKVSIKGPNGDFSGKVKSEKAKCLVRTVVVYELLGNGYDPANDRKVASDTSERQGSVGVWSVGNTGEKKGDFYAYAKRKKGCKKAFSKVLSL